jgi:hypothetical protein
MTALSLTERQQELVRACIDAELENNNQCDTSLSLSVSDDADDPDEATKNLRKELRALRKLFQAGE